MWVHVAQGFQEGKGSPITHCSECLSHCPEGRPGSGSALASHDPRSICHFLLQGMVLCLQMTSPVLYLQDDHGPRSAHPISRDVPRCCCCPVGDTPALISCPTQNHQYFLAKELCIFFCFFFLFFILKCFKYTVDIKMDIHICIA